MAPGTLLRLKWARSIIAAFFLLSGAAVTLALTLAAPSFWYFPCGILWALSGFVWLIRPSFAPGISIFPVLGIIAMLIPGLQVYRQVDSIYWVLIVCSLIALVLITAAFRQKDARSVTAIAISFCLVLTAFAVDRLFTNKVEVHSYSMNWSIDGKAPWGSVERGEKGEPPVLIYRMVNEGYCYDALFSPELKALLTASGKPLVTVEYNIVSDFGRPHGYNIRAVNGMVFNDGLRALRSENGYGGYVESNNSSSVGCHE